MKIKAHTFLVGIILVSLFGCIPTLNNRVPPPQTTKLVAPPAPYNPPVSVSSPNTGAVANQPAINPYDDNTLGASPSKPTLEPVIKQTHPAEPILNPKQVIRTFYQAISEKNCAKAIQLRPGYTEQRCLSIDSVVVKNVILMWANPDTSVVYLEIVYQTGSKPESFFGYVKLVLKNEQWLIVNSSYRSGQKVDFEQYLEEQNISS